MTPGVKASWHLADLGDADPFGSVVYSLGVTLDLMADEETLAQQYVGLLRREQFLLDAGLRCELKDNGQDCQSCPQATLDPGERLSRLCRLGKDECATEARIEHLRSTRLASVEELAQEADLACEIGTLPDDLAEYLTQVGV